MPVLQSDLSKWHVHNRYVCRIRALDQLIGREESMAATLRSALNSKVSCPHACFCVVPSSPMYCYGRRQH